VKSESVLRVLATGCQSALLLWSAFVIFRAALGVMEASLAVVVLVVVVAVLVEAVVVEVVLVHFPPVYIQ
jgi:hypothetical protein